MANSKISDLTNYTNPDAANDVIPIWDNANSQTKKITRNNYLGISGSPVGTSDSQVLSNKTIGNSNTITVKDSTSFILQNNADTSKQAKFDASGITTATTRTFALPDANTTLVGTGTTQTLTNKTLTAPVISGGSIDNSTVTVDTISGHTSANTMTVAGIAIASSVIPQTALPTGVVVQVVHNSSTAVATGTTVLPYDDTIPQNTEGDQYMSLAITPKATTNRLFIECVFFGSVSVANELSVAIFQDTTANALATVSEFNATATARHTVKLGWEMAAGTTSATTFKIRAGTAVAGTTTFNGDSSARRFGGTASSWLRITEVKA